MRNLPKREGFTLIELLIVIVIIGLLATIAVSAYWRIKNRGFEASLQADLKSAAMAQEQYFEANRRYAVSAAELVEFETSPGVALEVTYSDTDGWAGITTHSAMPDRHCGLLVGAAPAGNAGPAVTAGIVQCGDI